MRRPRPTQPGPTWALYVYIVADHPDGGLDAVARAEVRALIRAWRTQRHRCHLVVQADFERRVSRQNVPGTDIMAPVRERRSGSAVTLRRFFDWAVASNPPTVRHAAVLFWGHSAGPAGLFDDDGAKRARWKRRGVRTLSIRQLGLALAHGARGLRGQGADLDLAIFKNCAASSLEVLAELNGSVEFVVASQNLVPAEGWPYQGILEAFAPAGATVVARRVTRALHAYYRDDDHRPGKDEVPFALLRAGAAGPPLIRAVAALVTALKTSRELVSTRRATRAALAAFPPGGAASLLDVRTLCANLQMATRPGSPVAKAVDRLQRVMDGIIVLPPAESCFSGTSVLYLPSVQRLLQHDFVGFPSDYDDLRFARSGWGEIAGEQVSRPNFETRARTRRRQENP